MHCVILGASFDPPADNKAFADKYDFGFQLLSDEDRGVGAQYDAKRGDDEQYNDFAKRVSYLIDPEGRVARAYEVADPAAHPGEVLEDLRALAQA